MKSLEMNAQVLDLSWDKGQLAKWNQKQIQSRTSQGSEDYGAVTEVMKVLANRILEDS